MAEVAVEVELGERSYPVVLSTGGFSTLGAWLQGRVREGAAMLVTDDNVEPLWADAAEQGLREGGLAPTRVVLPAGEGHKTVRTWARVVDEILASGADRRTPVIALGGGVVGDITGFAAASAMRGMPFVQLPTTLLAMVDSSVGGKTGVNHPLGKNLVGAFHQPRLVYGALDTLTTLPLRELRAGLGEVVKTAMLGDADLFEQLERDAAAIRAAEPTVLASVIARCASIKAHVVSRDERESGWRAVLNFGHTVGHAIEAAAGYGTWLHGEAVAMGLVVEARWAVREGVCVDENLPERVARLFDALGVPCRPPTLSPTTLVDKMKMDKKAASDMLLLPVPVRLGEPRLERMPLSSLEQLVLEFPS